MTPHDAKDISHTFTVRRSPPEVFAAINDVRAWWGGELDGPTQEVGDVFTYRYAALHRSTQRIVESVPGVKVVWRVEDSHLAFVASPTEWNGTEIVFEIEPRGDTTQLRFTHAGVNPTVECFSACNDAWGGYIAGLQRMIEARPRTNLGR